MRKKSATISAVIVFLVTIVIGNAIASSFSAPTNSAQRDFVAVIGILQLVVPALLSWVTYRTVKGGQEEGS